MDYTLVILVAIMAVLIVAIVIGSVYHVKKAKFKPKFVRLNDGSLQMEFDGFGGMQTARTRRFKDEYKVGMNVSHGGVAYHIVQIKEVSNSGVTRPDIKMVCYLEKV